MQYQISVDNYCSITPQVKDTILFTLSNGLKFVKFIFNCQLLDVYFPQSQPYNIVVIKLKDKDIVITESLILVSKRNKLSFHIMPDVLVSVKEGTPIFKQMYTVTNAYRSFVKDVD